MNVSIFTPTNDTTYLLELYESIKDQPFYEWVIVYNNGAVPLDIDDGRIKSVVLTEEIANKRGINSSYVGALKNYACSLCSGQILLEVDHDDLLNESAVIDVIMAFMENPESGFVYSDAARFKGDFIPEKPFNKDMGWVTYPTFYKGHRLIAHSSSEPIPSSMSKIWYAPDHLRAWRTETYWDAGGHDPNMRVLDDQDLIARTYCITKFFHINKCLYYYRITMSNTWLIHNAEIQQNVYRIYNKYIEDMVIAWARRNSLNCLDLGGRFNSPNKELNKKYISVDMKNADVITDLNNPWPFADNSVGIIRAIDVFEHLHDPIHVMKEAYRVLAPNGYLMLQVPSTDGRGAFQDPTHVSFWNENSLLYYTNSNWAKYIDTPVRFMSDYCITTELDERRVCWVIANLIVLKGNRPLGAITI